VIIKNNRLLESLNLSISDRHVLLMINQNADRLIICCCLLQCASVQVEIDVGRKDHDRAPLFPFVGEVLSEPVFAGKRIKNGNE
jgi:hypothetical protein